MFFEKKYCCILCESFQSQERMKTVHNEIGICKRCYEKLKTSRDNCYDGGKGISAVFSPYAYESDIAEAIRAFKFNGNWLYGKLFGRMIYEELRSVSYIWDLDCIMPVPLHENRLKERGYNQAEIIAEAISEMSGIKLLTDGMFRIRETKRQSSLAANERRENVRGAFYAYPGAVSGNRIILVDDICTMGETIRACADALKTSGATEVVALTICKSKIEEHTFNLY